MPEAFAVVKETAKRFKENEKIEVEASPFDIELSSAKNYIKSMKTKQYGLTLGMLRESP